MAANNNQTINRKRMSINTGNDYNPKRYSQLSLNEIREINNSKFGHIPAKVRTNLEAARDAVNKENMSVIYNSIRSCKRLSRRKKSLLINYSPQRVHSIPEENSPSPICARLSSMNKDFYKIVPSLNTTTDSGYNPDDNWVAPGCQVDKNVDEKRE